MAGRRNHFLPASQTSLVEREEQQQSNLLSTSPLTNEASTPHGARGPRRPYTPGTFLSRNRFASSSTAITAVASSSVSSMETNMLAGSKTYPSPPSLFVPHTRNIYSRPDAASSGATLTNASSGASGQASPTVVFGEGVTLFGQEGGKLEATTASSLDTSHSGGFANKSYLLGHSHALYLDVGPEEDDWLHDVKSEWKNHKKQYVGVDQRACCLRGIRGFVNVCSLLLLFLGVLFLFMGFPLLTAILKRVHSRKDGHGLGGTNGTGQIPDFGPIRTGLIDRDTPQDAYSKMNIDGTRKMSLVFSDEFNADGRSFYPGDDPFWAGENLDYWETGDYEWYDPASITTQDGALVITLSEHVSHNKRFRSGLLSSWNKLCFTGGRIEVAVILPGTHEVSGFWPAVWMMGNLGRAGYGATTQGLWPYHYDSCDVGALPNQTYPAEQGGGPEVAVNGGQHNSALSYLPGQRLSRCTCPGEDHPGPTMSDGTLRGRGAPEIDVFEVSAGQYYGASQSLQSAPYNAKYHWPTENGAAYFAQDRAKKNKYEGGHYQQAISGVSTFSADAFENDGGVWNVMGVEYRPGKGDDAYIAWLTDGELTWSLHPPALAADKVTEISARPVPEEPMYVLINLGMSASFAWPDWKQMEFPAHLKIDWIRIYQPEGEENVTCDPPGFPTKRYIDKHMEAYTNWNLTTWTEPRGERGGYGGTFPKNRLLEKC